MEKNWSKSWMDLSKSLYITYPYLLSEVKSMININDYIPELQSINVYWEEVSYGIGYTKPHLLNVYVVYIGEDNLIGAILEDNGGLGFSFGEWINTCVEGTTIISPECVMELISMETFKEHQERMQALITLLNTSQKVQDAQKEVYKEELYREEVDYEQQPTEQEELEYYENEPYESMYSEE